MHMWPLRLPSQQCAPCLFAMMLLGFSVILHHALVLGCHFRSCIQSLGKLYRARQSL